MTIRKVRITIAVAVTLLAVPFASSLWRYWSWYPKVWKVTVRIDGQKSPVSTLYLDAQRRCNGVLVVPTGLDNAVYAFSLGDCQTAPYIWRCQDSDVSFLPGLAFTNHVQFGHGCVSGNLILIDSAGHDVPRPNGSVKRGLIVEKRSLQFIDDDGKRLKVEW